MLFLILYLVLIGAVAALANFVSKRWPKWPKERWGIRTLEAFYADFNSWDEAERYVKKRGWEDAVVFRLP